MTREQAMAQRMRRSAMAVTLMVVLACPFAPTSAQIYEWVDDAGDRHFENSLEQVPEAQRAQARVVLPAATPGAADATADISASNAAQPAADESQRDNSFESGWDVGYSAGWEAGYRAAADEAPVCTAEPPAVVLESRPPVVVSVPLYDPSGAYYRPPYGSTVTLPFDDGASRGLTTRNQIQQQRAIERGW